MSAMRFEDPAADFVPACRRIFGDVRVLQLTGRDAIELTPDELREIMARAL